METLTAGTVTTSRYITSDPALLHGEPIIRGTKTPVRAIVELWRLGTPPELIPLHLPHLTMAQVFDALSFYEENQTEINDYIEQNHVPEHLVHPHVRADEIEGQLLYVRRMGNYGNHYRDSG